MSERSDGQGSDTGATQQPQALAAPTVSLPKGGGAIRGIGEKFGANPVTGTGSMVVPLAASPGRSGFGPRLDLTYDSGAGNGPFGFGWSLSLPGIARKTDKGLPLYQDANESDVFILAGAEDLVPVLDANGGRWESDDADPAYVVHRYRPRVEAAFARIERWTRKADGDTHWRSLSRDNILTVYGGDARSRVADPAEPAHVFRWLICEQRDDYGNAVLFEYKAEDGAGVDLARPHERNRGARDDPRRTANRYLKRVRYGNRTPLLDDHGLRPRTLSDAQVANAGWMFELVLDYGEHNADTPTPGEESEWPVRLDPFSSYRGGFEVRTVRLCRRVLVFHHFEDEPEVGADCLVRSTDFTYSFEENPASATNPLYTQLLEVSESGYTRQDGGFLKRSLPPLEFEYSEPIVSAAVQAIDTESLENLPIGTDGTSYRWVDLHGEGIPGILTKQGEGWFYKRNVSPIGTRPVEFAPTALVAERPNVDLAPGGAQFMDLAGDGLPDLVVLGGPLAGLYEHDDAAETWAPFRPFSSPVNVDFGDPNLRLVDLDGDGRADVLLSLDDDFVWYASLGEDGFGAASSFPQALDEEEGPRLVFADRTEAIHLADLSGDGLADLVRIRNGECCYWPNLGRRFGAKVTMDGAPWFDQQDGFDPKLLRLADIDGSGTTDLIYLHPAGAQLYFNQSGNGWGGVTELDSAPAPGDGVDVDVTDLFANGTACLVWSSSLPDGGRSMRYVDLMGGQKPHLLVRTANNLGAETRIGYTSSTTFFLQDRRDGRSWVTRLPFPVQVVERVETVDYAGRNRFVTRHAYHHGYFDGEEREFRGFGMVEQWDTEELAALGSAADDNGSSVPPLHTKTWFHTGVYAGGNHVSDYYAGEYFREPGLSDAEAGDLLLPDTLLPAGLTSGEAREACRALKGAMLRREVYADDAGPGATAEELGRAATPYTVTEQSFSVQVLQPRGPNPHAAFFTHAGEALSFHYERDPADPRIQHVLTLEVDAYGNVRKEATVGYGRRAAGLAELTPADQQRQTMTLVTYAESLVTNAVESPDTQRNPLPSEVVTFELTGYAATGPAGRFQASDFAEPDPDEVAYEAAPTTNPCRRPIEWMRTLYRSDDLTGLLPLGELESLALPGESYKLAFTPGLLAQVFERPQDGVQPPEVLLPDPAAVLGVQDATGGGYVQAQTAKADGRFPASDADDSWWIPTGRSFFTIAPADPPAAELTAARAHFFLPRRYRDPFGNDALVDFDAYDLLMLETRDALGNRVTVDVNDYRVLQPRLVSDPNGNRTEVVFDALGLVAGTALMGKPDPAPAEGDSLTGFVADLTQEQLDAFLAAPEPHAGAPALLQDAGTRILYDVGRFHRTRLANPDDPTQWLLPCVATLARETHATAPLPSQGLRVQIGFTYSDGFGREIQKKIQAEPGPVLEGGPPVDPRWIGSGWTIFNNKADPVRKYEPFFTATHEFEADAVNGVSPVLFYDPVGRVIATLHPDHSYEKAVFDPWLNTTYDGNDTCAPRNAETGDPRTDPDISGYVAGYFATLPADPAWQTWRETRAGGALGDDAKNAATRAEAHADTPTSVHLDVLGRPFLTVAHNRVVCAGHDLDGTEESLATRVELDIEGNERAVRDADTQGGDELGRVVVRYTYDMLGNRIFQLGLDAGARWMLSDALGKPIRAWDSRGHTFTTGYDVLRRAVDQTVRGATPDSDPRTLGHDLVVGRNEYGEGVPGAETLNLRTRAYRQLDAAGIATSQAYDFKGNLLATTRRLLSDYTALPDWSANPQLDDESFQSRTRYDALNRTVQSVAPHSGDQTAVIQPVFNEANLIEVVDVWLDRDGEPQGLIDPSADPASPVGVAGIDYDAKGRRLGIDYKNGSGTRYRYDPDTFRLVELYTRRGSAFTGDCDNAAPPPPTAAAPDTPPPGRSCGLQNLHYTYDAAGNITHVRDDAQQIVFFQNKRVEPSTDYVYDAVYRLIQATGREHLGQNGAPLPHSSDDAGRVGLAPNDGSAMGTYIERYVFDAVGNVLRMQHRGSDPANPGWTRAYDHAEPSLIDGAAKTGNRLSSATVSPDGAAPQVEPYIHDPHGNIVRMPHLGGASPAPNMHWDYRDQLRQTDLGGGGTAYYTYDSSGKRMRKVWEKTPGLIEERIYLGVFEVFRRHNGPVGPATTTLERGTLHVTCGDQRVALVETRVLDTAGNDPAPAQLIRYQIANHLASSSLELDEQAQIISFEEYAPYGSSTYQAVRSQTETAKRFRYTGKERDEETGLYYHGARYYACWLGTWASPDPIGIKGGINTYAYCENCPVAYTDPLGLDEWCGLTDGFFGLFSGDCHLEPHIAGGIKTVGGALETAGGATMVVVGGATCEVGIGCAVAAAGVVVTAHGLDTTQSGFRSAIHGEQIDSFTSQGLQAAGVSRRNANLVDAGISVVGSFGASAATRAPTAAAALTEGGAQTDASISLALRPALGPGHNYVGVTTADGVTTWSHLVVDGATKSSGIGGTAIVEGIDAADMSGRLGRSITVTVPVSGAQADAALATVTDAIQASNAGGQAGFGAYSLTANSCSTYAASVMNAAKIATPPLTSPALNLGAAALRSPTVANALTIGGATVNTAVGALAAGQSPTRIPFQRAAIPFAASSQGVPNAADFDSFDAFSAAVQGPYSPDFIRQQWEAVHGPVSR